MAGPQVSHRVSAKTRIGGLPIGKLRRKKSKEYSKKKLLAKKRKAALATDAPVRAAVARSEELRGFWYFGEGQARSGAQSVEWRIA